MQDGEEWREGGEESESVCKSEECVCVCVNACVCVCAIVCHCVRKCDTVVTAQLQREKEGGKRDESIHSFIPSLPHTLSPLSSSPAAGCKRRTWSPRNATRLALKVRAALTSRSFTKVSRKAV